MDRRAGWQQRALRELCALQRPAPDTWEACFSALRKTPVQIARAGQPGGPSKEIPIISGQMLPTPSGKRVKVGQKKSPVQMLPLNVISSLGSPNTNLP